MVLTGKQRHHLRSLAHHLEPVVHVGHDGVTAAVLSQIDEALAAHELIKVRVSADAPANREEAAELIAAGTHSDIAQIIGRIVVVFRRRPTSAKKKAKVALSPGGAGSGQKGSKGRAPSQRAKAKAKTAVARAKKRQKLARAHSRASSRSRHGSQSAPDE